MSDVKMTTQQSAETPSFFSNLKGKLPKDTGIFVVMVGIALILKPSAGMSAISHS